MPKAVWKNIVLAESNKTELVEGNHYFPPESVKKEYLTKTDHRTKCPWKGEAHYYTIEVEGEKIENAAWFYPDPKEKARFITGFVAFGKDVLIEE